MTVRVDPELIATVCRAAASTVGARPGLVEVVVDPLDASLWVHLPAPAAVVAAVTALRARGLDTAGVNDHRVHVLGWNVRLLRWRLGVLLAAVDDLTTDLVCYHHDRRITAGDEVEGWAVLADVEATLRAATPLPHPSPRVTDLDTLLELTAAAGRNGNASSGCTSTGLNTSPPSSPSDPISRAEPPGGRVRWPGQVTRSTFESNTTSIRGSRWWRHRSWRSGSGR